MQIHIETADATPDEAAAIVAALTQVVTETTPAPVSESPAPSAWHRAAVLEAQGVPASPGMCYRRWGDPSRLARAARWSRGIVGS